MAQTGNRNEIRLNMLLGKMALDRMLITPEQLREALAEQARGVARGRKLPRLLGVILAEMKYLTDEQLIELLEQQSALVLEGNSGRRKDKLLGRVLVARRLASQEHVDECLGIQSEAIAACADDVPTMGDLLIMEEHATEEAIRVGVALVHDMTFTCRKCEKVSRFHELDSTKPYCCPACKGAIEPQLPALPPVDPTRVMTVPQEPLAPSDLSTEEFAPSSDGPPERPPDSSRPLELETLGKYRVIRELGRGGMGMVFEALDTQLERKVALKLMFENPHADKEEQLQEEGRFVREGRMAANLKRHPNIVSVYEAGMLDGRYYIAMELIEGKPMSQWRRMGSVTIRQQVRLLRDVSLAVHHAHQNGIFHRDLKPANVLVDGKNKPFVADFGLAKEARRDVGASLTVSGKVLGTPSYMSPEQARGDKRVTRRSDIWSLGVMLYEILTGRVPFKGQSPIEILIKVLKEPVPPPSSVAKSLAKSGIYKSIENVCMKALAKDPRDRYSTAQAFAGDLSKWLKGGDVQVAPPRSRRLPPGVLAGGAVAALLLAAVLLALPSRSEPLRKALARAEASLQAENYAEALKAFQAALELDPNNAKALVGREAARGKMELEAAQAELEESRALIEKLRRGGGKEVAPDVERRLREAEEKARQAEERKRKAGGKIN